MWSDIARRSKRSDYNHEAMNGVKSGAALVFLAIAAAALPTAAQTSLNPTVTLLPQPSGPVPPECVAGAAAATPRMEVGQTPAQQPDFVAPPSADLAARLARLQAAAAGDDYTEFKAALTDARAFLQSYPAGGERDAANDALQVYAD